MPRGFRDEDKQRDDDREPVEIEGVVAEHETALALLCVLPVGKGQEEKWIPKSQITDDSEVYEKGDEGKLIITGWYAEKEGLG